MDWDHLKNDIDGDHPLAGQIVGISISDSEDLRRYGFLPVHIDRAMAEIATLAAASGARIGYGGDLRPDGFTYKLFRAISELYGAEEIGTLIPPCIHYLAHPIWQDWDAAKLLNHLRALAGIAEVVLIQANGEAFSVRLLHGSEEEEPSVRISTRTPTSSKSWRPPLLLRKFVTRWFNFLPTFLGRDQASLPLDDRDLIPRGIPIRDSKKQIDKLLRSAQGQGDSSGADSFTMLRLFMAADEDARVALGGKTDDYKGHFPGIAEETLYSLAVGKPVIELAAFGGCAGDVAQVLLRGAVGLKRDKVGRGYSEIMERIAVGSKVFQSTLEATGMDAIYREVSGADSLRALGVGVLKCLEHRKLHQQWAKDAEQFVQKTLPI